MFFAESCILPLMPEPTVPWNKVVLLFCITGKKPIDVVPLIHQSLKSQINKDHFYFPCLISKLSKAVGLKHSIIMIGSSKGLGLAQALCDSSNTTLIEKCQNEQEQKMKKEQERREKPLIRKRISIQGREQNKQLTKKRRKKSKRRRKKKLLRMWSITTLNSESGLRTKDFEIIRKIYRFWIK